MPKIRYHNKVKGRRFLYDFMTQNTKINVLLMLFPSRIYLDSILSYSILYKSFTHVAKRDPAFSQFYGYLCFRITNCYCNFHRKNISLWRHSCHKTKVKVRKAKQVDFEWIYWRFQSRIIFFFISRYTGILKCISRRNMCTLDRDKYRYTDILLQP